MLRDVPILRQRWENVLFLHWPIDQALLRPRIPEAFELETYEGKAWIGIVAVNMKGVRPPHFPRIPIVSDSVGLNVRFYVRHEGEPGIWFFSLDASNVGAVLGVRSMLNLPYRWARMSSTKIESRDRFTCERRDDRSIQFEVEYTRLGQPLIPAPGSLEYFITERYATFSVTQRGVLTTRVSHTPWQLEQIQVHDLRQTMIESHGLKVTEAPLAFAGDDKDVEVFLPEISASLPYPRPRPVRSSGTL